MANTFDTDPENGTITIRFSNPRAAHHFKSWLCGSGEQYYWDWIDCREYEEPGPIRAKFDYWHEDPNVIPAECFRPDDD